MDAFLRSVERQAYRIALVGLGQHDDALDSVQEAMMRFVEKYRKRPDSQWKPLFYKILYNQIRTVQRKRVVRNRFMTWLLPQKEGDNPFDEFPGNKNDEPEHISRITRAYTVLEGALQELSLRQQQAFLLRGWEQMSVAETALAMGCSQGSVKTHYSRALEILRKRLGDHWP